MAIESRVAAVTGANKGIGLAIGRYLPILSILRKRKTTPKPTD